MSEGGSFLWKRQSIDQHRGPAGNYKSIQRPLPEPPENFVWIRNAETKEWRLEERPYTDFVATAEFIGESDLIVHDIQPNTDTFEGILLRYKVSSTALRQANNGFQGTNLAMAPNPLVIPTNAGDDDGNNRGGGGGGRRSSQVSLVVDLTTDQPTNEQKIAQLQKSCPGLTVSEAKAYLELNDWNVNDAFEAAREEGDHTSPTNKNKNNGNVNGGGAYYFEDKNNNNKKKSHDDDECTFLCNKLSSLFRNNNTIKVGIDNK